MNLKEFNALAKTNSALRKGIALPEYLVNEKIERGIRAGLKIEDLFMVIPCSTEHGEGEVDLETKHGNLKVFFCKDLYDFQVYGRKTPQALILSKRKYNYPKISKPSARPFKELNEKPPHIIS
jgi:hypothetical protein